MPGQRCDTSEEHWADNGMGAHKSRCILSENNQRVEEQRARLDAESR